MQKYYVISIKTDNFEISREKLAFTVQGLKERYRKTVQRWKPGDRIIYYVTKISKFGAIAEITSGYYRDETKIWSDEDEIWPSRAKSKPILVLEKDELLYVRKLVDKLSFIKNKEFWGLSFHGSVREIPEKDYKIIESEMMKVISQRELIPEKKEKIKELKTEETIKTLQIYKCLFFKPYIWLILGFLSLIISRFLLDYSWDRSISFFALFISIGALIFTWLQYHISARKPDLDVIFSNGKKEVNFKNTTQEKIFEIVIRNKGNGIAKFINLQVYFNRSWNIKYPLREYYFDFLNNDWRVIEYNGGIKNIVHSNHALGLKDWKIDIPSNQCGRFDIPYSIICENSEEKKGHLFMSIS